MKKYQKKPKKVENLTIWRGKGNKCNLYIRERNLCLGVNLAVASDGSEVEESVFLRALNAQLFANYSLVRVIDRNGADHPAI